MAHLEVFSCSNVICTYLYVSTISYNVKKYIFKNKGVHTLAFSMHNIQILILRFQSLTVIYEHIAVNHKSVCMYYTYLVPKCVLRVYRQIAIVFHRIVDNEYLAILFLRY